MNAVELQEAYHHSQTNAIKVKVQGYLIGFNAQTFPNSRVNDGIVETFHGSEIFYTAEIHFPEGSTISLHHDGFGTKPEYHKLGGGKLWIPIHAVELVK